MIRAAKENISENQWAWLVGGLFIGVCAVFMFIDINLPQLALWDESRLAVNAIEMYRTGLSFVTTYNFVPDDWNTKPPLLIWFMVLSMKWMGPSLFAIRLPSMLAALGTLAVTYWFVFRLSRSIFAAAVAVSLLAFSRGFFGLHAAATGDYDTLLTFFTTTYLCLLFFTLHKRHSSFKDVVVIGLLMCGAVLTKSVAGLVPLAGAVLYLILSRRLLRPFQSFAYFATGLMVVFFVVSFYALREYIAPGYLLAVQNNELGGRFLSATEAHIGPVWYYLGVIAKNTCISALILLSPLAYGFATFRIRAGLRYAIFVAFCLILIFSSSATKLHWYVVPDYPFLAISFALALHATMKHYAIPVPYVFCAEFWTCRTNKAVKAAVLLAVLVISCASYARFFHPYRDDSYYGELFAGLSKQGISEVDVVHLGYKNRESDTYYDPQFRFYKMLWEIKNLMINDRDGEMPDATLAPGKVLATCDSKYVEKIKDRGAPLYFEHGCIAVRL